MKSKAKKQEVEKTPETKAIKCRRCFMIDSYTPKQKKCFHCGALIYDIDAV